VSVGVAVYPEDGKTIDTLFQAADRALYKMKQLEKTA
jgi:GGDEF domain-containing protein